jgi:hypothetical protein
MIHSIGSGIPSKNIPYIALFISFYIISSLEIHYFVAGGAQIFSDHSLVNVVPI